MENCVRLSDKERERERERDLVDSLRKRGKDQKRKRGN